MEDYKEQRNEATAVKVLLIWTSEARTMIVCGT